MDTKIFWGHEDITNTVAKFQTWTSSGTSTGALFYKDPDTLNEPETADELIDRMAREFLGIEEPATQTTIYMNRTVTGIGTVDPLGPLNVTFTYSET